MMNETQPTRERIGKRHLVPCLVLAFILIIELQLYIRSSVLSHLLLSIHELHQTREACGIEDVVDALPGTFDFSKSRAFVEGKAPQG